MDSDPHPLECPHPDTLLDFFPDDRRSLGTSYEITDERAENPFREFHIGFHLPPREVCPCLHCALSYDAVMEALDEAGI